MIGLLSAASSVLGGGASGLTGGGEGPSTSTATSGGTFTSGTMSGGGQDKTPWVLVIGLVLVLAVILGGRRRG